MRTHGFRTHVLLVLAGAAVVVASLARPWYARAPKPVPEQTQDIGDVNGPLYGLFHGMQRWVTDSHGSTGWESIGPWATLLAAMAGIAAVSALCVATGSLQGLGRDPLRWCALTVAGVVAWRLVDPPGANEVWELRHGALVAAGGALVLLSGALPVAAAPSRTRKVTPTYVPPPPPEPLPVYDTSASVAPPGGPQF
jgi:hypothetical protein